MPGPRIRYKAECPECGCGLIDGLATDVWQEEHGEPKVGQGIEVHCPSCGKKHKGEIVEVQENQ
jgi:RNase P subunit RPR2